MMSKAAAVLVGRGRCMKSWVWIFGCWEWRSMRSMSVAFVRAIALSIVRAPMSRILHFCRGGGGAGSFGAVEGFGMQGSSQSARTRLESPPRSRLCPARLAFWYLASPPEALSCDWRVLASMVFLVWSAVESCFWRVWWVRIMVRVVREEGVEEREWAGRVDERRAGFRRRFLGCVILKWFEG